MSRFIDRRFEVNETTRPQVMNAIARTFAKSTDWTVLAHAVMSNHWHLVCVAGTLPSCSWTRRLNISIARIVQRDRRDRGEPALGAVFGGRPTFVAVPRERVGQVIAYVHLNPIRAKVVERPADSTWTSHRAMVQLDDVPRWLNVTAAMRMSGFAQTAEGRRKFGRFVSSISGTADDSLEWTEEVAESSWRSAKQQLGASIAIGAPELLAVGGARVEVGTRRPNARLRPADLQSTIAAHASAAAIHIDDLSSLRRSAPLTKCRTLALADWVARGGRVSVMARALGIGKSTAYRLLRSA